MYPIVARFSDADLRVKYYACESLYNVVKVARGAVLPQFSQIFSALSKIATDSEQSIKSASELLDRLMKVYIYIYYNAWLNYNYIYLGHSYRKSII